MTSPPTVLTNGALNTGEGCASIADAQGSLLFYTDGTTIWDKTHQIMANGNGMTGNSSSTQSAIILKKPGSSNLYYVFTLGISGTGTLAFSVVDMSLASGNGSVVSLNNTLSINCTEKLTAIQHKNGIDFWIVSHKWNSANFECYLLTSTGVNTTPVISSIGSTHQTPNNFAGYLKASPNGKKIALALTRNSNYELFDFNKSSGVISNSMSLPVGIYNAVYGCEFSPDGSKLYASSIYSNSMPAPSNSVLLVQFNLCAGNNSAILNSSVTIVSTTGCIGAMQRTGNGKIYVARCDSFLGVINNPNVAGLGCNYIAQAQSIKPKYTTWSLPNFMPQSISYTANCKIATFTSPHTNTTIIWNFGEPSSGANNTSTLTNPTHTYSTLGPYIVTVVGSSGGCSGNDTLTQNVFLSTQTNKTLSLAGNFTVCKGDKYVYTVSGAETYTWSNGTNSNSTSLSPSITTIYSISATTNG